AIAARDLERDVRLAWNALQQALAEERSMFRMDSIHAALGDIAELRYTSGDVPLVERAAVLARRKQAAVAHQRSLHAIGIAQVELQRLLRIDRQLVPAGELDDRSLLIPIDPAAPVQHPRTLGAMSEVRLAHEQRRLEEHLLLPDLTGRWFDQRIYGEEDRFRGYSLSIGVPLFFWDPRSRIRAA